MMLMFGIEITQICSLWCSMNVHFCSMFFISLKSHPQLILKLQSSTNKKWILFEWSLTSILFVILIPTILKLLQADNPLITFMHELRGIINLQWMKMNFQWTILNCSLNVHFRSLWIYVWTVNPVWL